MHKRQFNVIAIPTRRRLWLPLNNKLEPTGRKIRRQWPAEPLPWWLPLVTKLANCEERVRGGGDQLKASSEALNAVIQFLECHPNIGREGLTRSLRFCCELSTIPAEVSHLNCLSAKGGAVDQLEVARLSRQ